MRKTRRHSEIAKWFSVRIYGLHLMIGDLESINRALNDGCVIILRRDKKVRWTIDMKRIK